MMQPEAIGLIKKSIGEGKDRHQARRDLVSAGMSTDEFDMQFNLILAELRIDEPKQKGLNYDSFGELPARVREGKYAWMHTATKIGALVVICIVVVFLVVQGVLMLVASPQQATSEPIRWGEEPVAQDQKNIGLNDNVLETKVEATFASAKIYYARLQFYDGVCKDVSVVAPIKCLETSDSFVLYTPLSNGSYFCMDAKGYKNTVQKRPETGVSCL